MLIARGTPAFDGDQMSQKSHSTLSEDEKAFHRVMATMFGIRNQLMYNVENLNKEIEREEISKILGDKINLRSIDVIITRLRKKIEIDPKNPKFLQTIRGAGYVLWIE